MNINRHLTFTFSLALLLGLFSTAHAQEVRNTVERAQDRNQIQNDQATIQRDRAEIQQFRGYRAGLSKAITNNSQAAARGHYMKMIGAMEREVQQSQNKSAKASVEVRQSNAEIRSDNREIRRDRQQGKPLQTADSRRDRRDDVRDRNDDRNDLAEARLRADRQQEILTTIKSINVNTHPNPLAALNAKMNLIEEFEQTMIRDMGENWEELNEDKRELREDRRETWEDRRK